MYDVREPAFAALLSIPFIIAAQVHMVSCASAAPAEERDGDAGQTSLLFWDAGPQALTTFTERISLLSVGYPGNEIMRVSRDGTIEYLNGGTCDQALAVVGYVTLPEQHTQEDCEAEVRRMAAVVAHGEPSVTFVGPVDAGVP